MKRGELYLAKKPAPPRGVAEGLKKDSSIHCDELVSQPKTMLTHYVGTLSNLQMAQFDSVLRRALVLE